MSTSSSSLADGSTLCLACGLCCTGLLFDIAPLEADELDRAERLGLPLARTPHRDGFALPCPRQRGSACTVYAERPRICASYACGLLRAYRAGAVDPREALERVARLKALADEVRKADRAPKHDPAGAAAAREARSRFRILVREWLDP